jgi:DNA polymerase
MTRRYNDEIERAPVRSQIAIEPLWLTHYANIFDPARVKVHAMETEMPKKYWRNLPETAVIPQLSNEARI